MKRMTLFVLVIFLAGSCKIMRRTLVPHYDDYNLEIVSKRYDEGVIMFRTVSVNRANIGYQDSENELNLRANFRMKQDSFVYANITALLGIELARALFQPETIQVIDRINNRFIDEDYSFLLKLLGFHIGFDLIQKLITGNFEFDDFRITSDADIRRKDEGIVIYDKQNKFVLGFQEARFTISETNFKLLRLELYNKLEEKFVVIEYSRYATTEKGFFPEEIRINVSHDVRNETFTIGLGKPVFDSDIQINFQVPAHYRK